MTNKNQLKISRYKLFGLVVLFIITGVFINQFFLYSFPFKLSVTEYNIINIIACNDQPGLFNFIPLNNSNLVISDITLKLLSALSAVTGSYLTASKILSVTFFLCFSLLSYILLERISDDTTKPIIAIILFIFSPLSVLVFNSSFLYMLAGSFFILSLIFILKAIHSNKALWYVVSILFISFLPYITVQYALFIVIPVAYIIIRALELKVTNKNITTFIVIISVLAFIVLVPLIWKMYTDQYLYNLIFEKCFIFNDIKREGSFYLLIENFIAFIHLIWPVFIDYQFKNTVSCDYFNFILSFLFLIGLIITIKNYKNEYNLLIIVCLIVCFAISTLTKPDYINNYTKILFITPFIYYIISVVIIDIIVPVADKLLSSYFKIKFNSSVLCISIILLLLIIVIFTNYINRNSLENIILRKYTKYSDFYTAMLIKQDIDNILHDKKTNINIYIDNKLPISTVRGLLKLDGKQNIANINSVSSISKIKTSEKTNKIGTIIYYFSDKSLIEEIKNKYNPENIQPVNYLPEKAAGYRRFIQQFREIKYKNYFDMLQFLKHSPL